MPKASTRVPAPVPESSTVAAETGADDKSIGPLTIRFGPDGRPNWESMRADTKAKFRQVLADPGAREILADAGLSAPSIASTVTAPPSLVPDELIDGIYRGLETVTMIAAGRMYPALAPAQIKDAVAWTDDERARVRPSTARVLAKYGAAWLIKYGDECALAMALVSILGAKAANVAALAGQAPRGSTPVPTSGKSL